MSRIAAAGPLAAPHTMAAATASSNAVGRPPLVSLGGPAWLADFLDSVELEVHRRQQLIQQQSISK